MEEKFRDCREKLIAVSKNLEKVIQGKSGCIEIVTVALASAGSILLEDVPGVGKTTLAKALALSIDATFHRIQFTPDLLPADILGSTIYNPADGTFYFRKGPVFCNVLLADEINRASPRTQSALLEAMNEKQATIEGERHALPEPFLVIATENPVEFHGTYPLPEAQLDRFLVRIEIGYPDPETELSIIHSHSDKSPVECIGAVTSREELIEIQRTVRNIKVHDNIVRYMVLIGASTRADPRLKLGVSPRGLIMLNRACQARAFLSGREYVLPDDVQKLAPYVLAHRVMLASKSKYGGETGDTIVREIVSGLKVPA
ncbi:MAG: MoxR family ATPase [Candidatus Wallbacteria bacterium]|nr:MoxR family ATPase [Candidatus Wallbacteria bacterium]